MHAQGDAFPGSRRHSLAGTVLPHAPSNSLRRPGEGARIGPDLRIANQGVKPRPCQPGSGMPTRSGCRGTARRSNRSAPKPSCNVPSLPYPVRHMHNTTDGVV